MPEQLRLAQVALSGPYLAGIWRTSDHTHTWVVIQPPVTGIVSPDSTSTAQGAWGGHHLLFKKKLLSGACLHPYLEGLQSSLSEGAVH